MLGRFCPKTGRSPDKSENARLPRNEMHLRPKVKLRLRTKVKMQVHAELEMKFTRPHRNPLQMERLRFRRFRLTHFLNIDHISEFTAFTPKWKRKFTPNWKCKFTPYRQKSPRGGNCGRGGSVRPITLILHIFADSSFLHGQFLVA